jgi:hypothetical protein
MLRLVKPWLASKPMWATCEKPVGAPIRLLSIGAPLFRLLLRPVKAANLLGECEWDDAEPGGGVAEPPPPPPWENLAAYLLRIETFLKSSAASDSEEKAIPIMQS